MFPHVLGVGLLFILSCSRSSRDPNRDGTKDLPADPSSITVEVAELELEASPLYPDLDPLTLTAHGQVHASGERTLRVAWTFEIRDAFDVVRSLSADSGIEGEAFHVQTLWDGLDAWGEAVSAGTYAVRGVAEVIEAGPTTETVVGTAVTAEQLVELRRLRGVVDFHTHPLSHLGFGEKALHGAPDIDLWVGAGQHQCNATAFRATSIDEALGNCESTHGSWTFDNPCGDIIRAATVNHAIDAGFVHRTGDLPGAHEHEGYPALAYWPHPTSILHQQMWWEWIERAHRGGLSVMVALTVNNELLAEILNGNPPYDDRTVAERQIAETIRMVERHAFMEVAYSSSDLIRIVGEGKLAVILGMEVDRIGNYGRLDAPTEAEVRAELQHLHRLGVRYVFPIHLVDNAFGGAAVYDPLFSFANHRANGYHFTVEHSADPFVTYDASQIEELPIAGTGASISVLRGLLEGLGELPFPCFDASCSFQLRCCGSIEEITDLIAPAAELEAYATIAPGHVNTLGLTPLGEVAIDELMRLSMFIDLDHMSEKAMTRVVELAEGVGHTTGTAGYPLVFGHSSIRGPRSTERLPPRHLVQRVAKLGGMHGAGSAGATPASFIETVRELQDVLGPDGVGIGTDVNGFERLPMRSAPCVPGEDLTGSQAFYFGFTAHPWGLPTKATTGHRTWDYVLDCGVAHYGLMPEFLVDVGVNHGADDVYTSLMRSSIGLARMWRTMEDTSARLPVHRVAQ